MKSIKKKKIVVVTGTRAEYGLLYPVIKEMQKSKQLTLQLLVTGMHTQKRYGHTIDLIKKDKVPIAAVVPVGEKDSMLTALSKEIQGIEKFCIKTKPDLIFVDADRDEGFAGAIVGGHLGIPVAHLGGGDVSGAGVDELIRHAISKFSHIHFPISQKSAKRLQKIGESMSRIHITGSTAFDRLDSKSLMSRSMLASQYNLDTSIPWILFAQHPTPLDGVEVSEQINRSLQALSAFDAEKIILYPNSDTGTELVVDAIETLRGTKGVTIERSLPHLTYLSFLKQCDVIVGNSSSGIVEAGYFHTPSVNIGNRQRNREHSINVIHVGYDTDAITRAITKSFSLAFIQKVAVAKSPYHLGNASKTIVRILEKLKIDDGFLNKQPPK